MTRETIKFFIFLLFLPTVLFGSMQLQDRLLFAKEGDFVVFQINQLINVIIVKKIENNWLVIEEICLPKNTRPVVDWKKWVSQNAPGHTSWITYRLDPYNKKIYEPYSITQKSRIILTEEDSFVLKLFSLSFHPIPLKDRKKIGIEPMDGSLDTRKIWDPPLVVEGKKIKNAPIEGLVAIWPKDSSELSGKRIECYFFNDKEQFALPFWIQITDDSEARFNIIGIDCGRKIYDQK